MNAKYSFYLLIFIMVAIIAAVIGYVVLSDEDEDSDNTTDTEQTNDTTDEVEAVSLSQLEENNTEDNCWIAYDGAVYDVTKYLSTHPGGPESIILRCGEDVTEGFDAVGAHGGVSASDWEEYYVGDLE